MMLSFDHLRTLTEVAELGSFGKAARRMYLSQPAISQRIRAMEEAIGQPLFDRSSAGTSLQLTSAGHEVLRFSETMLRGFDDLCERLRTQEPACQTVVIATGGFYVDTYVLPKILPAILSRSPGLHARIVSLPFDQINDAALNGKVDVAFQTGALLSAKLSMTPAFEDEIIITSHPSRPLLSTYLSGHQRESLPIIVAPRVTEAYRLAIDWCHRYGLAYDVVVESHSLGTLKSAVMNGIGYGFIPELTVRDEMRDGLIIEQEAAGFPYQRLIVAGYSAEAGKRPPVAAFLHALAAVRTHVGIARRPDKQLSLAGRR